MTVAELKKLVEGKKLIIGAQRAAKEMKKDNVKKLFLSSTCAPRTKATLEAHAKIEKIEVSHLDATAEELGVIVKKPFAVSVVAVAK